MWLVLLSIRRPIFILMVEMFLITLGLIAFKRIGVDYYPKIEPPIITIVTEYPGAGPAEIESLITKPIEQEVNQIGSIERLISTSRENISQVTVEFLMELDAREMQIEVRDKIARIKPLLPRDTKEPMIQRLDFSDRPIMRVAVTQKGNEFSDGYLYRLTKETIKPFLEQIDGIGQLDIFGGREREVQVNIDRNKLLSLNISAAQVAEAIRKSNQNIPAGELFEEPQQRGIRILGEFATVDDIKNTLVAVLKSGKTILVQDLAEVRDSFREPTSMARVNGHPVVVIEVKKQSGANTVEVATQLKQRMKDVSQLLPPGVTVEPVYDASRLVDIAVSEAIQAMLIAAILAIIVVYFFLGSFQSTLITGLALPSTAIATFFALYVFDFTLNNMSLLGLTLAVGLVLDDAIVIRENIWRKMEEGLPPIEAAEVGSREVVTALIATTLTILAVFFPVTFIPGIVGKFFATFALTVCVAILVSTFDALTMAPLMSAYLAKPKHRAPSAFALKTKKIGTNIVNMYRRILTYGVSHPLRILAGALGIFMFSMYLKGYIGFTFLPNTEFGEIDINVEAPIGSTLSKTNHVVQQMEAAIRKLPAISYISAKVGNHHEEPHIASLYVRMDPPDKRTITTSEMKSMIRRVLMPLAKSENLILGVQDSGSGGAPRQIMVAVQGPDLEKLAEISGKIIEKAAVQIPEAVNLTSNLRPGRQELQLELDRKKMAAFGIKSDDVGSSVRLMFQGTDDLPFRMKGEEFNIRSRLREVDRTGASSLNQLTMPREENQSVPFSSFSNVVQKVSPARIVRIDQMRAAQIEGDLDSGAPLGVVVQKLSALIKNNLPTDEFRFEFLGQAKSMRDLGRGMVIAFTLGTIFIYMIMASLYESLIIPFSILITLPLAIVGAFLGLLITGQMMDLYSVIGMILLMGLVTKNAILLVDYVEKLRASGMSRNEALIEGGARRLRPIMMTTIAMIAGMLPIAMGHGELNKTRAGMGIACIGGLISSTLLSLIVVPCLYIYLDRFREYSLGKARRFMRKGKKHVAYQTQH